MKRAVFTLMALALTLPVFALDDADPVAEAFKKFRSQENQKLVNKFTFVRVKYDSTGGYSEAYYDYDGRRWLRWETDYPEADENFIFRIAELTTVDPNPRAIQLRLTEPELFNYPFIYICDPGWMYLTKEEQQCLRRYLLQGGFLWVDDFWGDAEWENLRSNIEGALPEYEWRKIGADHEILNIVFKLKECPQVPARDFAESGWRWDPPGIHREPTGGDSGVNKVNLLGLFHESGRLMAVATHNTDLGDGFEREAEGEWYFETYSTKAYAMGINIIVYALTH